MWKADNLVTSSPQQPNQPQPTYLPTMSTTTTTTTTTACTTTKLVRKLMTLLTTANAKIRKGEKSGYRTFGIHLAPSTLSGYNTCKWASAGCAAACLNTAGMGVFSNVQLSRIEKTLWFFKDKPEFLRKLIKEIKAAIKKANKAGLQACFRPNLTSDLPWEKIKLDGQSILEMFPDVQFYDYTKSPERMSAFLAGELPSNYHLTFSRSETNGALADAFLAAGGNVAIVFRKSLPETYKGYRVINGDETDLRFLDGSGNVIGLVEKGRAKKDLTGFVVEPTEA